ncbi:hypothetical protein AFLA_005659 [Aspergillus flavus NRRL3357]|nr:hypothetical protein AFLA_005659 [Aspergillus flavus NRRL3357]
MTDLRRGSNGLCSAMKGKDMVVQKFIALTPYIKSDSSLAFTYFFVYFPFPNARSFLISLSSLPLQLHWITFLVYPLSFLLVLHTINIQIKDGAPKETDKKTAPKESEEQTVEPPSFLFSTSPSPHHSQLVSSVLPNTFLRLFTVLSPSIHWFCARMLRLLREPHSGWYL